MIPVNFSDDQINKGIAFIKSKIKNSRVRNGEAVGDAYVNYGDLAQHFGWDFETEGDSKRIGDFAFEMSKRTKKNDDVYISSIVVNKDSLRPGKAYYEYILSERGINVNKEDIDPQGKIEMLAWVTCVNDVVNKYGRKANP